MINKAIEKITKEAMEIKHPMAIAIEEYLTNKCTSNAVARKLLDESKSIKGIYDKIYEKAKKKAKEDARAEVEATLGQNAEDIIRLEAEVERLEAENAKMSNTTLMEFKVYVDQLQDIYFRINDLITEESQRNEEAGAKMQAALQKIVEGWRP